MSQFFSNLINRHLGTCSVVEPRMPSRFETERITSQEPSIFAPLEPDDTPVERREHTERVVPSPERRSHWSVIEAVGQKQRDSQIEKPIHLFKWIDPTENHLDSQDKQARSGEKNAARLLGNPMPPPSHLDTQQVRQMEAQPHKPIPGGKPKVLHDEAVQSIKYRDESVENERLSTSFLEAFKHISGTDQGHAKTDAFGDHFLGDLEARLRRITARFQAHNNSPTVAQLDVDSLDRAGSIKPENRDDRKAARVDGGIQAGPLFDATKQTRTSFSNQDQPDVTSKNSGDTSDDAALAPPNWFSDMQADFNRRWNKLDKKSQSEPVVNVTIGRVEVRAEAPKAPPKARSGAKPSVVMTLDAYLNQRRTKG